MIAIPIITNRFDFLGISTGYRELSKVQAIATMTTDLGKSHLAPHGSGNSGAKNYNAKEWQRIDYGSVLYGS